LSQPGRPRNRPGETAGARGPFGYLRAFQVDRNREGRLRDGRPGRSCSSQPPFCSCCACNFSTSRMNVSNSRRASGPAFSCSFSRIPCLPSLAKSPGEPTSIRVTFAKFDQAREDQLRIVISHSVQYLVAALPPEALQTEQELARDRAHVADATTTSLSPIGKGATGWARRKAPKYYNSRTPRREATTTGLRRLQQVSPQ
jgi:hypothetical protein